jgi:hypothetical protein
VPTKIFKRKPHATGERQKEEDFSLRARRNRHDARPTRPRERIKPTFTMVSDKPIARFASEKNFSSSFIASFPLPFSSFSASSSFRSRNNKPRKPFKSAFESLVFSYFEKFEEMSAQDIIVIGFFFVFAITPMVVFTFAKLCCLRVYEVCALCDCFFSRFYEKKRSIFVVTVLFFSLKRKRF